MMTDGKPRILVERDGMIATVRLSNPGKLNALTVAMWQDLARAMQQLSADDELRCVVLRGAGSEAFAAGADIAEFATALGWRKRCTRSRAASRRTRRWSIAGASSSCGGWRRRRRHSPPPRSRRTSPTSPLKITA